MSSLVKFTRNSVHFYGSSLKGDLSGFTNNRINSDNIEKRITNLKLTDFNFDLYPVHFFDVFEKKGIPVRTTISDIDPELLGQILDLNETQSSVLSIIFKIADDQKLLLLDLKDLKSMIEFVTNHRKDLASEYGNLAPQSLGSIQRALIELE